MSKTDVSQFVSQFPVECDDGHFHVGDNPQQADAQGKDPKKRHSKEAGTEIKQPETVSFHQLPAGMEQFHCGEGAFVQA